METTTVRRRIQTRSSTKLTQEKSSTVSQSEDVGDSGDSSHKLSEEATSKESKENWEYIVKVFLATISALLGLLVMVGMSYKYSVLIETLHENNMWFTNIKEVEREISFRTESGLYYSYYKQMVNAPSISRGIYELSNDNITEHFRTINILERFNVYQEVVLAILYKTIPYAQNLQPIFFYIHSVFTLNGILLCFLYLITWSLGGSWLGGALTAAFYVLNKADTTRVPYTIPLRESFSLPFLWGQVLCISLYLRNKNSYKSLLVLGIFTNTFLFALTWQFAQFVLLLQAAAVFAVWVLDLIPKHKVMSIYFCQMLAMFGVYILQFGNKMLLGALVIGFIPAVLIVLSFMKKNKDHGSGFFLGSFKTVIYCLVVAALTIVINKLIKFVIDLDADEHIFKFVMAKFGFGNPRDFDSKLYLCNDAFKFLTTDPDVFKRLSNYLVFPLYALTHAVLVFLLSLAVLRNWCSPATHKSSGDHKVDTELSLPQRVFSTRPELAYHTVQMILFGGMALAVLRMKYLWTPYMCIMGGFLVSDSHLWAWITENMFRTKSRVPMNVMRHVLTALTLGLLLYRAVPPLQEELEQLREFYDPDTVELMEWIQNNTPKAAAFSGSMQLLAGVKLCTGRPLTNHPHYEDKHLRERTKELYQMYGKYYPEEVHWTLQKYGASYIILEDSICLSPQLGCRLPDIMDLNQGVLPDGHQPEAGLETSNIPKFCDEIRRNDATYTALFKLVFSNPTFRVYKIL